MECVQVCDGEMRKGTVSRELVRQEDVERTWRNCRSTYCRPSRLRKEFRYRRQAKEGRAQVGVNGNVKWPADWPDELHLPHRESNRASCTDIPRCDLQTWSASQ
jgi:hypothetical protein